MIIEDMTKNVLYKKRTKLFLIGLNSSRTDYKLLQLKTAFKNPALTKKITASLEPQRADL